jgi:eukaryotic-like serine/threonine-protein kinase
LAYGLGTVVGSRYRLTRIRGRGGMAVVYQADDLHHGRPVAVKMLEDELRRDQEIRMRFAREGIATQGLPTSFLVNVLDAGVAQNDAPYVVMDFLHGKDLGAALRNVDKLPWDLAVGFIVQACAGIAAAHDRGIIHRDLKPANLFLVNTTDGIHVRVLDFGVSKDVKASEELTNPSGVLGTTGFMAPEQLRDAREVDARSDVWALGIILYRMIVGEMPMRGTTAKIIARTMDHDPLPRVTRLDVPRGLAKVIARALDKNPKGRPPDARAFARALAPFAEGTPIVSQALAEIDRSQPSIVVDPSVHEHVAPTFDPPAGPFLPADYFTPPGAMPLSLDKQLEGAAWGLIAASTIITFTLMLLRSV